MIRGFFLLLGLMTLFQCSDKEVLLPVIAEGGIAQTENHSSIWIFYDPDGKDSKAVLNKNNKLINTNWIFNIDRRLSMTDVIPLLQNMQADRNKDSMHKKEGMINFFSYADSKNERISLVNYPEISFVPLNAMASSNKAEMDSTRCLIPVRVHEDHLQVNGKSYDKDEVGKALHDTKLCEEGKRAIFRLMYDEELSFQSYLETKVFLAAAQVSVDTIELVETLK